LTVPAQLRALFVVGLAALVTPLVDVEAPVLTQPAAIAVAMGGELLLGVLIGLVVRACFTGIQMGGTLIAQESGLAYGSVVDPSGLGEDENVVSIFYVQLAMVTYLIVGGHRALVTAALDTFVTIPLLADTDAVRGSVTLLCDALRVGFDLAVRVAAPAMLTMFLVNVVLGFLSRTVPQLNVTLMGFSFKTLLAFLVMAAALPAGLAAFTTTLDEVVSWLPPLWTR
jgi:flagellar biosynthetic protein FliR